MKSVSLSVADFQNVCRLCLTRENLITFDNLDPELLYFLRTILECDVTLDIMLPQNVCSSCVTNLQLIDNFIQKFKQSTEILMAIRDYSKNDPHTDGEYIYVVDDDHDRESITEDNRNWEEPSKMYQEEIWEENVHGVIRKDTELNVESENNTQMKLEINNDETENNGSNQETENEYQHKNRIEQKMMEMKEENIRNEIDRSTDEYDSVEDPNEFIEDSIDSEIVEADFSIDEATEIDTITEQNTPSEKQNDEKVNSEANLVVDQTIEDLMNNLSETEPNQDGMVDNLNKSNTTEASKPVKTNENMKVCEIEIIGCCFCGDTFQHLEHLFKHYAKFEICKAKHLYCSVCCEEFEEPTILRNHLMEAHEGIGVLYKCKLCSKEFKYVNNALSHEMQHLSGFTCDICGLGFNNPNKLRQHKIKHAAERIYNCEFCSEQFVGKRALNSHYKTHNIDLKRLFKCKTCGQRFERISQLHDHIEMHRVNGELEHLVCEFCSKVFTTKQSFKWHKKIHEDQKSFLCTECGKSFRTKFHLKQHSFVHVGIKQFKCEVCSTEFHHMRSYSRHIQIHRDEQRHICEDCGKIFPDTYHLKAHSITHTKEKNYICSHCGERFMAQRTCDRHERIHVGEKPYQCIYCPLQFTNFMLLKKHQRSHKVQMITKIET